MLECLRIPSKTQSEGSISVNKHKGGALLGTFGAAYSIKF